MKKAARSIRIVFSAALFSTLPASANKMEELLKLFRRGQADEGVDAAKHADDSGSVRPRPHAAGAELPIAAVREVKLMPEEALEYTRGFLGKRPGSVRDYWVGLDKARQAEISQAHLTLRNKFRRAGHSPAEADELADLALFRGLTSHVDKPLRPGIRRADSMRMDDPALGRYADLAKLEKGYGLKDPAGLFTRVVFHNDSVELVATKEAWMGVGQFQDLMKTSGLPLPNIPGRSITSWGNARPGDIVPAGNGKWGLVIESKNGIFNEGKYEVDGVVSLRVFQDAEALKDYARSQLPKP